MFEQFIFCALTWTPAPIAWQENILLRSVMACATAFLLGIILAPIVIHIVTRLQLVDSNEKCDSSLVREQNKAKKNTPIMGGLIIAIAVLISSIFWANLEWPATGFLFTIFGFSCIGLIDDIIKTKSKSKGLRAKTKMLLILLVSGAVAFYIWDKFKDSEKHTILYFLQTEWKWSLVWGSGTGFILWSLLVFAGSTNATNLTDGMDGLATVCTCMLAVSFAILAFIIGDSGLAKDFQILHVPLSQELTVCSMGLLGACLAFLWYNSHPASIFMGDSGSLMLGGILAYSAIILRQEILYFIMAGIFVMEAISVIIQVSVHKICKPKDVRVFRCAPIHHHFALGAWKHETKVTMRFWIMQIFFILLGLSLVLL